jgi:hypothetical protein
VLNLRKAPFPTPPFFNFRVSPFGVVPKKVPGEFRLIHHLSFPRGASINHGISPEHTTVSYSRVDDAIAIIKKLGRGCFLAKTDIKSAFPPAPLPHFASYDTRYRRFLYILTPHLFCAMHEY